MFGQCGKIDSMPDAGFLKAVLELAKAGLSEAAKERLKEFLHEKAVVPAAIRKTVSSFSTQLPGLDAALRIWVTTETFASGLLNLCASNTLPENVTRPDDFVRATGLTFGTADLKVVAKMLHYFYTEVRTGALSTGQGLLLIDNTGLEVLRQLDRLRREVNESLRTSAYITNSAGYSSTLVQSLAGKEGWSSGINFAPDLPINIDLPPQVDKLVSRPQTVQYVIALLSKHVCYAMSGGSGSGKTQLAILVAGSFTGRKIWIRLGPDVATACLTLELALSKVLPREATLNSKRWCELVVQQLPPSSLFVLDDCPRTNGATGFDEMLVALCAACSRSAARIIAVGADLVPYTLRQALGSLVISEPVPEFSESEALDLLRQYGATETFLASAWAKLVQLAARRHPVLLVQAAVYLRERNWAADNSVLEELLNGTFAGELDSSTVNRISETVPDASTRELLYRVKLIGWPFSSKEVQRVSAIPPTITLPMERLHSLVGLWVQRDSDREFVVSPLVSRLDDDNVPEDVQKLIYARLGRGILQQRVLGPIEVSKAVNYFVRAAEFNSAAAVLATAYQALIAEPETADPLGLSAIWAGLPYPAQMELDRRILLRSMQVVIRHRLGKDTRYERTDLERLLKEAEHCEGLHLAIVSAAILVCNTLAEKDPTLAIRVLRRALRAFRAMDKAELEIDLEEMVLSVLWMAAAWIQTDSDYLAWFSILQELTQSEVERWVALDIAEDASKAAASGIWTRAVDLKTSEPRWAEVTARLRDLEQWAASHGALAMQADAICAQIVIAAEYQTDLPFAQLIADRGISEIAMPKIRFVIAECMARQHDYFGSVSDALSWYDLALRYSSGVRPTRQVALLMMAGVAAQPLDEQLSHEYLRRGVRLAERGSVDYATGINVRGELAIALWNSGQKRAAYELWRDAAQELLLANKGTERWKGLFMIFGNCSGYFASAGKAVSDSMTIPFTGIFMRDQRRVADLYEEEKSSLLPAQLALFAQDVNAFEEATNWACRVPSIDGLLATVARTLMLDMSVGARLRDKEYLKVIESAALSDVEAAREPLSFAELGSKETQRRAEAMTAQLTVIALLIEIVRIALHDRSRAQAIAHEIFEKTNQLGTPGREFDFWTGVADAFHSVASQDTNHAVMSSKAAAAARAQVSSLQVAFSLAAMLSAAPVEALRLQIQLSPWLERLFSPTTYHFTLGRLIPEFWISIVDAYPINFGFPQRTRRSIEEASRADADRLKVRGVVGAVALSLGLRLPADVQKWLNQVTPGERLPL